MSDCGIIFEDNLFFENIFASTTLRFLDLQDNMFGDVGLESLIHILSQQSHDRRMDIHLERNEISPTAALSLDEIKTQMPYINIKIHHDYNIHIENHV